LLLLGADIASISSFLIVLRYLFRKRAFPGLSIQSLTCAAIVRVLHLLGHAFHRAHITHWRPQSFPIWVYVFADAAAAMAGAAAVVVAVTFRLWRLHENCVRPNVQDTCGDGILGMLFGPRALAWRQMDWMALYAIACALSSAWMLVRTPHVREPGGDSFGDNVLTFLAALQEVLGAMWVIPQLLVFHREKVVYRPFARYVAMATIERVLMLVFHAIRALVKPWERQNVGIQVWCEAANVVMLSRFSIAFLRAGILGDAAFVLEV